MEKKRRGALAAKMRADSAPVARLALVDLPLKRLVRYESVCRGFLGAPADPQRAIAEHVLRTIAAGRQAERVHYAT
jgi:hypothetical protein